MNIIPLISLISCIICFFLGIAIYRRDKKSRLHIIFMILCLIFIFTWGLIEFGYRQAEDIVLVNWLLKINIFWYFVMPVLLHFIILATENNNLLEKKLNLILLYSPALFLLVLDATTNVLLEIPERVEWGWVLNPEYPIIYFTVNTWALIIGLMCLYLSIKYYRQEKNYDKKVKARYIIVGLFFPVVIGLFTSWLFPILGYVIPISFVHLFTLSLIFFSYALWNYEPSYNKYSYHDIKNEVDALPEKKANYIES